MNHNIRRPAISPNLPDESCKLASIGVGYKASEHFQLNASCEHVFLNQASINAAQSATLDKAD